MILGKVIGNVVATAKHPDYTGCKILLIHPVDPTGLLTGKSFLAVDVFQAGIGDIVVVIDEGGSGRDILDAPEKHTVRTVVAGVVDAVTTV